MYVASVAIARDLPPLRPTTNAASSIRSPGSRSRPVSCLNCARSSSLSASPIAAIMRMRHAAQLLPVITLPSRPVSARATRSEMVGLTSDSLRQPTMQAPAE
jgi:hypothetical protein